jgi:ribosomal protein L27
MKRLIFLLFAVLVTSISLGQSVEVKDNNNETLIKINDEGISKSSITIQNSGSAPGILTDKLYNVGHSLFWNGSLLGTGGSSVWSLNGSNAYYNSGKVGIGTITPFSTLSVGGNGLAGSAISGKTTDDYGAGIYGEATGTFAIGVLGKATNTSASSHYGGFFEAAGMNGIGVYGKSLDGWAGYFIGKSHFDGHVGIGTSTPTRPLTVFDPTVSYAAFQYLGSGNGVYDGVLVGAEPSGGYLWNCEDTPLSFGTNNERRMTIAADGNVGIGIDTPAMPLTVYHANIAWAAFQTSVTGHSSTDGLLVGHTGQNAYVRNLENNPLYFSTNDDIRLSIAADGKVGIGTLAPTRPLTVYHPVTSYGIFQNDASGSGSEDGVALGAHGSGGYLWNYENAELSFATNNMRRMTIHANGNVGIGTTTPAAGLHLKGSDFPNSFMYLMSDAGNDAGFRLYEGTTEKWHIYNNGATEQLNIRNNANHPNVIIDQSTGNVGIAIDTPQTTLHVGDEGGLLVQGTLDSGAVMNLGTGTRMHFYPKKAAFRAGRVEGSSSNQWDDSSIGRYSTATGYNTEAYGEYSTAMGSETEAFGIGSFAMGTESEATGSNSVAMGLEARASGSNSVAIGEMVGTQMSNCFALGRNVGTGSYSGCFIIGDGIGSAKYSNNYNQMTMRFSGGYRLFTDPGSTIGAALLGGTSSWGYISDSTRKENYHHANGDFFLHSIAKLKLGSWNYIGQNSDMRHYGPMAQEIFHYFGNDGYGTVGNDTILTTADMDGIMMIAIQALEKRTTDLLEENKRMKTENEMLKQRLEAIENKLFAQHGN